ncbi:MAG: hypothetical protein H6502_03565 [Candidatus Woesearchaeota archaeon]|nr:MAG: hypothetical protein H6502_03565 [Candidatus Woesearchaeota archaeon]
MKKIIVLLCVLLALSGVVTAVQSTNAVSVTMGQERISVAARSPTIHTMDVQAKEDYREAKARYVQAKEQVAAAKENWNQEKEQLQAKIQEGNTQEALTDLQTYLAKKVEAENERVRYVKEQISDDNVQAQEYLDERLVKIEELQTGVSTLATVEDARRVLGEVRSEVAQVARVTKQYGVVVALTKAKMYVEKATTALARIETQKLILEGEGVDVSSLDTDALRQQLSVISETVRELDSMLENTDLSDNNALTEIHGKVVRVNNEVRNAYRSLRELVVTLNQLNEGTRTPPNLGNTENQITGCETDNECINLCSGCYHVNDQPEIDCAAIPQGSCTCVAKVCTKAGG